MARVKAFGVALCLWALSCLGCGGDPSRQDVRITGETMGTTYRVRFAPTPGVHEADIRAGILKKLAQIDAELSNWRSDSWITRFNQLPAETESSVPPHALTVLQTTFDLAERTDGALDPTVSPLVELWGFGAQPTDRVIPTQEQVAETKLHCGIRLVRLNAGERSISKAIDGLALNLSAVTKGYAVDLLCRLLSDAGVQDFLVDIGGEIRGQGTNADGQLWRVGVAQPVRGRLDGGATARVLLDNQALATSGTYQQFKQLERQTISHVIDPATGYPVENNVVSVSVLARTCAEADGLATAGLVMGAARFIALVESLSEIEALVLVTEDGGGTTFKTVRSSGWPINASDTE